MNKWVNRWEAIFDDFVLLKKLLKDSPDATAGQIHEMGRKHFTTDILIELLNEQDLSKKGETPLEEAYRALTKVQAMFPHCPFCGRRFPGHCVDTCITLRTYQAMQDSLAKTASTTV